MPTKVRLVLSIFSILLFTELSAQQNVYFTGVGRALVTNDRLSDNTKLASRLKGSGGYTMFDLGINAKVNEIMRGGVILRVRNEFGGFFGDGASLEFRQLQMEGLIAKKVKYEIGDIYLKHTRYTLWNEDPLNNKFESSIFTGRRDIVNYENFFIGNAWRMQGINTKARLNFEKGIKSLDIRLYGGRSMQTNFINTPERYFYGGRLDLTQSKYLRIAGNLAGISDIPGTVKAAAVDYSNMVYTTDFDLTLENDNVKLMAEGEVGASHFELKRASDSSDTKFDDYFYDLGLKGTYKPLGLTLGASYRDVGFNFNSPMAQTRRIASPSNIALSNFGTLNDGSTPRPIGLYDMYTQEKYLYNQSISTTLMSYYVQYTMAEPYGRATPNRKGYTFTADLQMPSEILLANVEANFLSESVSEGDSITNEKRKFTLIKGGLKFNIHKLLNLKKAIAVNGGIRTESSNRGGINPVSLSSTTYDVGVDIEVIENLHLLGGGKFFSVSGNEIQSVRNSLNQITTYGPTLNFNQKQQVLSVGMRYDLSTGCYFSMNYNKINYNDELNSKNTYNWDQWFFVFGLKF
ncbi:MAG TPA: hypothetical protein VK750_07680 [Cytophagaceae bacterium]|jgi:hypothetical protein|nr:hypothetical protein [Cytophagaceae bacterium]